MPISKFFRSAPKVRFFLPIEDFPYSISEISEIDADRNWHYFGNGISIWILQTYLRLARKGYPVDLVSETWVEPARNLVVRLRRVKIGCADSG